MVLPAKCNSDLISWNILTWVGRVVIPCYQVMNLRQVEFYDVGLSHCCFAPCAWFQVSTFFFSCVLCEYALLLYRILEFLF